MKEKILVSACFLHEGYKYDGKANINPKVKSLEEKYEFIIICPEVFGELGTPRLPSEKKGDKVINSLGIDVTKEFNKGALMALDLAKEHGCSKAILKAKSPSCGKGIIYDGTFTHTKTKGNGVACELLLKHGIEVFTEEELDLL
jgi:uncharacterized protein YbbK (DUF523 family)